MGDFLAFLSRDHYPACSHRVVRPPPVGPAAATVDAVGLGRLSLPFLVRPRSDHVLDTRDYAAADNPRLVAVEGVRCADLRRLFDARGKRMLDARREQRRAAAEAARAEAARRARAKAYREAVLAGRPLSPVDSSEDEDPG